MKHLSKSKSIVLAAAIYSLALPAFAQVAVEAPKDAAAEAPQASVAKLTESDFKTVANGSMDLSVGTNSPIFAEFQGSDELTSRLRAALKERGFVLAESKDAAKSVLTFRGEVVLTGGPVFYRGLKLTVAEATDRTLKAEQKERPVYTSDVVQGVAGVAINAAGYTQNVSNFMRGMYLQGMANAIGESTGAKGWFNTKVAGDPRGICLSKCEDWKKVTQSVYMFVSLEVKGGENKEVRIVSRAVSETVAPEQVITVAVGKAVEQINVSGDRPVTTSSINPK